MDPTGARGGAVGIPYAFYHLGLSLGIVMVEAVRCDGIPTCWKKRNETLAPDEVNCDNDWLNIWTPGEIFSVFW